MISKRLGFEIRKIGDAKAFYRDVDSVLANANVPSGGVNAELQTSTIAHALQRMIANESHFSVCTVDRCMRLSGVVISAERYAIYSAIHCMNWNEMEPDYRQVIVAMLMDDFRSVLCDEDESPYTDITVTN